MKAIPLMVLIPLILTSCSIYKKQFDCPPDSGIPCTCVTDLERMIVEANRGPDLFLGISLDQYQIHKLPVHPEEKCCKH